jgi:hypothetical protein
MTPRQEQHAAEMRSRGNDPEPVPSPAFDPGLTREERTWAEIARNLDRWNAAHRRGRKEVG